MFIWGWSPILGKGISIDAIPLVWYRIGLTVAMMGLYLVYIKASPRVSPRRLAQLAVVGLIICIHWLCFYGAIKVSNVSVTMAAFSTGTLFTAIIEPLVYRRRIVVYELIIGLIIIGAICLIFSVEFQYGLGILLGILAAFTAAIFSVCNGVFIQDRKEPVSSPVLSFVELTAAFAGLSIFLACKGSYTEAFFSLDQRDVILLIIFAGVCTVYPFIASVNLMKHLTPYTINLTVNLEGLYGIVLASLLFHENKYLSTTFYVGFSIILAAIFLNAYLKQRYSRS